VEDRRARTSGPRGSRIAEIQHRDPVVLPAPAPEEFPVRVTPTMRIPLLPDVQELGVSVHVHAGILTMALLEGSRLGVRHGMTTAWRP
jgi:hypothetical protein